MRGFGDIELGNTSAVGKIARPSANAELAELEEIHRLLREANENSKSLHQSSADVSAALAKAKQLKLTLRILHTVRNGALKLPAAYRTPTSVVAEQRMKLKETMESSDSLRLRISNDYREAIGRRYFTVTGNTPQEAALDDLISSGEAERFLEQQGGGGEAMDAVKEIQKNLLELHQLFLDMAVLQDAEVQQQNKMARADTLRWTCVAIILLLLLVLVIVLSVVFANLFNWPSTRRRSI